MQRPLPSLTALSEDLEAAALTALRAALRVSDDEAVVAAVLGDAIPATSLRRNERTRVLTAARRYLAARALDVAIRSGDATAVVAAAERAVATGMSLDTQHGADVWAARRALANRDAGARTDGERLRATEVRGQRVEEIRRLLTTLERAVTRQDLTMATNAVDQLARLGVPVATDRRLIWLRRQVTRTGAVERFRLAADQARANPDMPTAWSELTAAGQETLDLGVVDADLPWPLLATCERRLVALQEWRRHLGTGVDRVADRARAWIRVRIECDGTLVDLDHHAGKSAAAAWGRHLRRDDRPPT